VVNRIMKENKYIPGIYNYCDRWCERCPLKDRCLLYAKEAKRLARHKTRGEDPYDWNIVMQDIKEDFGETLTLLRKFAEEQGIDINELPEEEPEPYDPSNHPLMKTGNNYFEMTRKYLEELRKIINEEREDLAKRVEIIPSAEGDIETLKEIISNYEIISWYHTLISVKIHRALQGKMEHDEDEFAQSDADGSAKVAYIGIMKSMNALKVIYDWDENHQEVTLTLLVELEKIRRDIDREFPGHQTFKRPGFDK